MIGIVRRYPTSAGFVAMFAFTWPVDLWAAAASRGRVAAPPAILPLLVGYGFVIAAVLVTGIVDGRHGIRRLLRRFLVWRVGTAWYVVVLFGPPAVGLTAVALHLALGGDSGEPFSRQVIPPGMSLVVALPLFLLFNVVANGEEIGWRGYALPRLQARYSALISSLLIGGVWSFWHLPKLVTEGSPDYPIVLFVLDTTAKAVLSTWVFNGTAGSLLTVSLFHASVNTGAVFLPLIPTAGDIRPYAFAVGLYCLAAVAVTVVTGAERLSRRPLSGALRENVENRDRRRSSSAEDDLRTARERL